MSGKCVCTGLPGSPPCYDCTFSLKQPPPNYASLSENKNNRGSRYVRTSSSTRRRHISRRSSVSQEVILEPSSYFTQHHVLQDPASLHYSHESLYEATDVEVAKISRAMGHIGLAVACLVKGQRTETAAVASNVASFMPASAAIPYLHHKISTSKLDLASQARCPPGHRLSEKDYHLLLTAIINHLPDHLYGDPALPQEVMAPLEASPLPCQLLVPE